MISNKNIDEGKGFYIWHGYLMRMKSQESVKIWH